MTLKDCTIQTFQAGGKGGQHQNHSNTGVRIIHDASGAVGVSRNQRSQHMNMRAAFISMSKHPRFRVWVNRRVWTEGRDPEAEVRREMQPHHLLVEANVDGEWKVIA